MNRVPQTIIETFAKLALEFDRTAIQDNQTFEKEKVSPGYTAYGLERASYLAGWAAGKTPALEAALRALAPDDWNNTIKRWCAAYEKLDRETS